MVAVLTVLANHLWGWPRGGFVGVDVFFVISGFLITGNLLRIAERSGTVSFRQFYWNRVRRIVPAATVVLILVYLVSLFVFLPFRSHQIGVDALFAFLFMSNWWFASQGTDYFAATDAVSPLQHYWSLSIEEQFYFVWPALIFVISAVVIRHGWAHGRRMKLAGCVMGVVSVGSLGLALYQSATSPTWAYFNTFTRVWELGAGALLATAVGALARIPRSVKPLLSWMGLVLVAASLVLIGDGSMGFPAPWALLPVAGAVLVIAAGVGSEPKYQGLLRNPVSTYIGNISYSLYLVHWPVIVILGTSMGAGGWQFSLCVVALSFALASMSYHVVENPLRHVDRAAVSNAMQRIRNRRYWPEKSTQYAAAGALTLVTIALIAYVDRPGTYGPSARSPIAEIAAEGVRPATNDPKFGPLTTALQAKIVDALKTTGWPALNPTMESVITGPKAPAEVYRCGDTDVPGGQVCMWGSDAASTRAILVGNSIGMNYSGPLREIALDSDGKFWLRTEAMSGCPFVEAFVTNGDQASNDACPGRKKQAIDLINTIKPDVVIIANSYNINTVVGTGQVLTTSEWVQSMRQIVDEFRSSTTKVVFLAPPPADVDIRDCYGTRSSKPVDCVSQITDVWNAMAKAERDLAESIGGMGIDSRRWFCNVKGTLCPSFVGLTPTKLDRAHMSPEYGHQIHQVIAESLREAGVF